jgi:folate-binding protein YgfZ
MISGTSAPTEAYRRARGRAGFVDRAGRGRIVVSGADRRTYLQGLLTNDIEALTAGRGCYAAYLTPQGRMIADLWVYELGDIVLLAMEAGVKDAVLARLDQFIFSEDVQLGDVTDTFDSVAVLGPESAALAASLLEGASAASLAGLPEHGNLRARFRDQPAIVLRITELGEPGYDIVVEAGCHDDLLGAAKAAGALEIDGPLSTILRVEAGIPKFGVDMDQDTIPLEAGIEDRAISLTKGCYVGQEVIIRVLHRGHGRVARKLVGLTIDGSSAPPHGALVRVEGRDVGRITSGVVSVALDRPIALAYVHRDAAQPGTRVDVDGVQATVTALPFVKAPS